MIYLEAQGAPGTRVILPVLAGAISISKPRVRVTQVALDGSKKRWKGGVQSKNVSIPALQFVGHQGYDQLMRLEALLDAAELLTLSIEGRQYLVTYDDELSYTLLDTGLREQLPLYRTIELAFQGA